MTKHQTRIKKQSDGVFFRNLGWKRNGKKRSQPKFRLGRDETKAGEAVIRLELLWSLVVSEQREKLGRDHEPSWSEPAFSIAKAIEKGQTVFTVPRPYFDGRPMKGPAWVRTAFSEFISEQSDTPVFYFAEDDTDDYDALYVSWLRVLQERYPVIAIRAADKRAFRKGTEKNTELARGYLLRADRHGKDASINIAGVAPGQRLHKALDSFAQSLTRNPRYTDSRTKGLSRWGSVFRNYILDFKNRYEDQHLSTLGQSAVQRLYDYWRFRPTSAKSKELVSPYTARNRIQALKEFLKWLHVSEEYDWRFPEDYELVEKTVPRVTETKKVLIDVLSKAVIKKLHASANPIQRAMLLLGLNCGYRYSELRNLMIGDIEFEITHPHAELIHYSSEKCESFIRKRRHKTGVYGEHVLWSASVQALKELIGTRRGGHVFLKENGLPMGRLGKNGKPVEDFQYEWNQLVEELGTGEEQLNTDGLLHSMLRKTGANYIRQNYGGEIEAVYLNHGSTCKDNLADLYANRPFSTLFVAIRDFGRYLGFDASPDGTE